MTLMIFQTMTKIFKYAFFFLFLLLSCSMVFASSLPFSTLLQHEIIGRYFIFGILGLVFIFLDKFYNNLFIKYLVVSYFLDIIISCILISLELFGLKFPTTLKQDYTLLPIEVLFIALFFITIAIIGIYSFFKGYERSFKICFTICLLAYLYRFILMQMAFL